MEQSEFVEPTLRIYERLRAAGHANVVVLQAYLYRSPSDLERLLPLAPNVRVVKGAYFEPAEIAHPEKRNVDTAYVRLVERARGRGARRGRHPRRANHPARTGAGRARGDRARPLPSSRCSTAFDPGCNAPLWPQSQGARRAPFGPDWYPYLMRRLAERPANPSSSSEISFADDRLPAAGGRRRRRRRRRRDEHRLAEAGVDVCLLERDALSSGSTSRAAGGVRTQFSDP